MPLSVLDLPGPQRRQTCSRFRVHQQPRRIDISTTFWLFLLVVTCEVESKSGSSRSQYTLETRRRTSNLRGV